MGECLCLCRCPRWAALPQARAGSREGERSAGAPGSHFLDTRNCRRQPGLGRKWLYEGSEPARNPACCCLCVLLWWLIGKRSLYPMGCILFKGFGTRYLKINSLRNVSLNDFWGMSIYYGNLGIFLSRFLEWHPSVWKGICDPFLHQFVIDFLWNLDFIWGKRAAGKSGSEEFLSDLLQHNCSNSCLDTISLWVLHRTMVGLV